MSGLNSQKVGSLSEKACGLEMERNAKELGYTVVGGLNRSEFEAEVEKCDFSGTKGEDLRFAITAGRALGGRTMDDIFARMISNGLKPEDYEFSFRDTSKDACHDLATDDLCATLTHKLTHKHIDFPLSLKTKSKTGNRIDGSSSANNISFLSRVFEGTDLVTNEALASADDSEYRKLYNEKKKIAGVTLDKASDLVNEEYGYEGGKNGNGSNDLCWKAISKEKLGKTIATLLETANEADKKAIVRNILNLGGFKPGTFLALALREKGKSTTHVYTSINCPIYRKLASGEATKVEVIINRTGTFGGFNIDGFELKLDYVPSGMKLMVNPLKALKIK